MAKKKKKKKTTSMHPEAKALILFSISLFFLLSLISFTQDGIDNNWLGSIGYYLALGLHYLIGFGAYLVCWYLFWVSFKIFKDHKFEKKSYRFFLFLNILISICILLNVFAESNTELIDNFKSYFYTESATLYNPQPTIYFRFNLGGVPFYFLYLDFPIFNLKNLLSNEGILIIFSALMTISFILIAQIELKSIIPKLFSLIFKIIKKILLLPFRKSANAKILKKDLPAKKVKLSKSTQIPNIESEPVIHTLEEKIKAPDKLPKKPFFKPALKRASVECKRYTIPSASLLTIKKPVDQPTLKKDLKKQAMILENALLSFGIEGKVGEINCGPTITSFEVQPPVGVKVQKIKALENDLALNLEAKSIRIIAPIPGKAAVGIEIPSVHPQEVNFREVLQYYQNQPRKLSIPLILGQTVSGENVIADLAKMPHCLIAGATGSGKSVCINTLVMSILMNAKPDEVKLVMIDPKKVELTQYSSLPHMIAPVISEPHGAYAALQWLVSEMQSRYDILKKLSLRNIGSFNNRKRKTDEDESIPEKLPFIVCIIDEFADLMMVSSSDIETPIARIAQMARAVGIHLVLATQRPSREVITGIIKANIPTRIAFKVANRINSQIILDETGAEGLLGNGDMLFLPPGTSTLVRSQGAFISDDDINQCIETICSQAPPNYLIKSFDSMRKDEALLGNGPKDELYDEALSIVVQTRNASTTFLQRKLKIGYARAASIMDELEENGVISAPDGSKPRRILIEASELNS
jgi:DNA segregation ATPase FtsK/SpoIIIE, S-DNA-T family